MTSSSLYSAAFWCFPFKLRSCTCRLTSGAYRSRSPCFVMRRQFSHGEGCAVALPGSAWHQADLINPSRRQLWSQWQAKGSPLKLALVWFLLIDLPDPRMENKLCWMPCICGFPPFIPGVTSVRSQGDERRRRGAPSLQQWLFL